MAIAAEHFILCVAHADKNAAAAARRFRPMGGLQIRSFHLQARPLDNLDFASNWRQLAARSTAVRMRISGSGVFAGAASDHFLAQLFLSHQHAACRLDMPGFGRFTGPFVITELAYEARHEDEVSWRIGLQSAADIRFDPEDNE